MVGGNLVDRGTRPSDKAPPLQREARLCTPCGITQRGVAHSYCIQYVCVHCGIHEISPTFLNIRSRISQPWNTRLGEYLVP